MKLLSLNVGLPREVPWHNTIVTTGIFKQPVSGRLALRKMNLDGDRQADLRVHGGEYKAVYCYPVEHYPYWQQQLPGRDLPFASFGENFTTEGLLEDSVHLGDRFAVGSAEVVVTQPRLPCYKLGVRFESDEMVKRFLSSARTGFYLAVTREGEVGAGDEIKLLSRDSNAVAVSEISRLYVAIHAAHDEANSTARDKPFRDADAAVVHRALQVPCFPESWKSYLRERLPKVTPRLLPTGIYPTAKLAFFRPKTPVPTRLQAHAQRLYCQPGREGPRIAPIARAVAPANAAQASKTAKPA